VHFYLVALGAGGAQGPGSLDGTSLFRVLAKHSEGARVEMRAKGIPDAVYGEIGVALPLLEQMANGCIEGRGSGGLAADLAVDPQGDHRAAQIGNGADRGVLPGALDDLPQWSVACRGEMIVAEQAIDRLEVLVAVDQTGLPQQQVLIILKTAVAR